MLKSGSRFLSTILAASIRFLRPLLGPARCRFAIGCTQFAITLLTTRPFANAIWHIGKRLLLCSPLGYLFQLLRRDRLQ